MYSPFHYQISEYDCVPTAIANAVSFLFKRKEIPPPHGDPTYLPLLS